MFVEETITGLEECLDRYQHVFAVMDSNVAMSCPAAMQIAEIMNRRGVPGKLIDASEEDKTMDTVMDICGWLLDNGADRDALVLAVGGGITTDMVGFAASIYKRGVRFAYVPTTLLAQVDASVGGKTGVNFERYKNMLGVIRQPEFTYVCPGVLASLPHREFTAGVAEMLLQSHEGFIDILPAVPDDWAEGYFKGLTARGGYEVDVRWESRKIKEIRIISKAEGICKIKLEQKPLLNKGFIYENGFLTFKAKRNNTYTIKFG